jgi:hypothetical protein
MYAYATVGPTKLNPRCLRSLLNASDSGEVTGICCVVFAAEFGLSSNEPPAVGVEGAELFPDVEKRPGIAHRGLDLHEIADDLRISQKAPGVFLGIAC